MNWRRIERGIRVPKAQELQDDPVKGIELGDSDARCRFSLQAGLVVNLCD